jgi:hypothetical protein
MVQDARMAAVGEDAVAAATVAPVLVAVLAGMPPAEAVAQTASAETKTVGLGASEVAVAETAMAVMLGTGADAEAAAGPSTPCSPEMVPPPLTSRAAVAVAVTADWLAF